MVFKAPDGKEFTDRTEYRKYIFLTQCTFKDRCNEVLKKMPGEIEGQPFDLTSLRGCEVLLLDHSEAVHVDELTDCRVFIAACADSVFVRNCSDCAVTVACKQLRTRDCTRCEFRLYCKTEPIIETSTDMTFAPFSGAYRGHADHLRAANLSTPNLWFGVYDFNDEAKTGKNWRLLPAEEEGEPWRPLDDGSEVVVPRTEPGSIPLPSKRTSTEGVGDRQGTGATMAFSLDTSAADAAAIVQAKRDASRKSAGENPPDGVVPSLEASNSAAGKKGTNGDYHEKSLGLRPGTTGSGSKPRIGWDPFRIKSGGKVTGKVNAGSCRRSDSSSSTVSPQAAASSPLAPPLALDIVPEALEGGRVPHCPGFTAVEGPKSISRASGREHVGGFQYEGGLSHAGGDKTRDLDRNLGGRATWCGGDVSVGCKASRAPGVDISILVSVPTRTSASATPPGDETPVPPAPSGLVGPPASAPVPRRARVSVGWDSSRISGASPRGSPLLYATRGEGCGKDSDAQNSQSLLPPSPADSEIGGVQSAIAVKDKMRMKIGERRQDRHIGCRSSLGNAERQRDSAGNIAGAQGREGGRREEQAKREMVCRGGSSGGSTRDLDELGVRGRLGGNAEKDTLSHQVDIPAASVAAAAALERGPAPVQLTGSFSRVGNFREGTPLRRMMVTQVLVEDGKRWRRVVEADASNEAEARSREKDEAPHAVDWREKCGTAAGGGSEAGGGAATVGAGGGSARGEVPLQLRALLLYASEERGIELSRWFDVRQDGKGVVGREGDRGFKASAKGSGAKRPMLTPVQFELILAGLAEGLKAGLSAEERKEIDAAVSPEVVKAAAAVAKDETVERSTPASGADCTASGVATGIHEKGLIDVGRLLDLCGVGIKGRQGRDRGVVDAVNSGGPFGAGSNAKARVDRHDIDSEGSETQGGTGDGYDYDAGSGDDDHGDDGDGDGDDDNDDDDYDYDYDYREGDDVDVGDVEGLGASGRDDVEEECCNWECRYQSKGRGAGPEGSPSREVEGEGGEAGERGRGTQGREDGGAIGVDRVEETLREVTVQTDLYNRLMESLGLRPPVSLTTPDSRASWDTRLKASTVSLQEIRKALEGVGLVLSPEKVAALAVRACASLVSPESPPRRRLQRLAVNAGTTFVLSGGGDGSTERGQQASHGTMGVAGDSQRVSSLALRAYLVKMRTEPRPRGGRQQRRRRQLCWQEVEGGKKGGVLEATTTGTAAGEAAGVGPADFETWGRKVRGKKSPRDRGTRREFQKALAGEAHCLRPSELEECLRRYEVIPAKVMSRELVALSRAFVANVDGARRVRELIHQWNNDSPASRNLCGLEDPLQEAWETAQCLSCPQRRCRARAMVAREKEKELAGREKADAFVSRRLFSAYAKAGAGSGGAGGLSFVRWLGDRQLARKKARELNAGRQRVRALSRADTEGRQALVSEVKEELMRLVGDTKKTQRANRDSGMEVLRSSRDGLDMHRRVKRLERAAEEERAASARRRPEAANGGKGSAGKATNAVQVGDHHHLGEQRQALVSKEVFNSEMGDVLFSLTADGAVAARARELAGVPLVAAELRKNWAKEACRGGGGGGEGKPTRSAGRTCGDLGVPFASDLFTSEETLLLGRGMKEVERKRNPALKKYREWSRAKVKETRRAKKKAAADREEKANQERQRKADGLRAYHRWIRLASKQQYFSHQQNKAVPRSCASSPPNFRAKRSCSKEANPREDGRNGRGGGQAEAGSRAKSGCDQGAIDRKPWDSSVEEATRLYDSAMAEQDGLPQYL